MQKRLATSLIALGLAALVVGALAWWLTPPRYVASTALEFEGLFAPAGGAREEIAYEFFKTQQFIITSQSLCLEAADALLSEGYGRDAADVGKRIAVTTRIRDGLRVQRVPGSRVISIAVGDADPKFARAAADAVVRAYSVRVRDHNPAERRLGQPTQLENARIKVEEADVAVVDFMRAHKEPLTAEYLTTLTAELSHYSQALATSRVRGIELTTEVAQLEESIERGTLHSPRLQRDQSFVLFQTKLSELQIERVTARARGDPDLKVAMVDAQIKALSYELAEHARSVLASAKAELTLLREQQRQISQETDRLKQTIAAIELHRVMLAGLQRSQEVQHKRFEAESGQNLGILDTSGPWSVRESDESLSSACTVPLATWIALGAAALSMSAGVSMVRADRRRRAASPSSSHM